MPLESEPGKRRIEPAHVVWAAAFAVVLVAVGYPLFMLIYRSLTTTGGQFTLEAYRKLVSDPYALDLTYNTLKLAVVSTVLSIAMGVPLAWIVTRTDIPAKNLIRLLSVLPFILPPYVGAIAWIQLLGPTTGYVNRLYRALGFHGNLASIYSFGGLVLVMTTHYYVYVFLTTSAALEQMDPSLEEAARMSGASMLRVAREITIPLVAPSIASGALLTFIAACANFGIPALIGTRARYHVLTTKIYSMLSIPDLDRATTYSMLLLLITGTALLIQRRAFRTRRFTTITGKTVRPSVAPLGKWKIPALVAVLIFLTLSSVIPLVSLVFSAFLKSIGRPLTDRSNYTLDNFKAVLFRDRDTRIAIRNSLMLSLSAATIITLFGALLAYIIVKTRVRGRLVLDWLSSVPYALPGTVVAVAMIFAYIKTLIFNTLWLILLAYFTRYMSYGVRTTVGSLLQIDPSLEEAARMSGASWLRTMRDVVIPLIKPALVAGWILVFMPTLSELTVSIILYPPGQPTIGVATFNLMDAGYYPWAYAMSAIVTFVVLTGQLVVNKVTGKLGVRGL